MDVNKNFLIVLADDDLEDKVTFEDIVSSLVADIDVVTFEDGEKLLHYLLKPENQVPDLLFLDMNMPCKDGLQVLEVVKKSQRLKDIFTVIYSTSDNPSFIDRSYELKADGFIKKTPDTQDLKRMLLQTI